jgi:hypothetical protein
LKKGLPVKNARRVGVKEEIRSTWNAVWFLAAAAVTERVRGMMVLVFGLFVCLGNETRSEWDCACPPLF